ncbi:hypothetical protein DFP72DRAFT_877498 [Ephemerocybe angulata]|uniref:Uncharacterized protein n=1 Tax=Ephemerocybe angulata TaxID=980116 RepID=A0A8H6ICM9_9AGAR|nr:hypothetical protein DFP72DRAFT_877498 [Tulosesus angulatus]
MKSTLLSTLLSAALVLRVQAYIPLEEGAFNVRRFHLVERAVDSGEIVSRAFLSSYDIVPRDSNDLVPRRCHTISACGTPGGCMMMAAQTYCDGEDPKKGFQRAVKQTGAIGRETLKLIGTSLGSGPVGTIAKMVKNVVGESKKAHKQNEAARKKNAKKEQKQKAPKPKKAPKQKKARGGKKQKRELEMEDGVVVNRRDFEIVERDEDMNFVGRSRYSTFDLVSQGEGDDEIGACEEYDGEVSCM